MDGCLDDNDLQAFFRGRLSASRASAVQQHVDGCSACRHLVAEVARSTSEHEALPGIGRTRPATPNATREPELVEGFGAPAERVVIRDGKVSRRPGGAPAPSQGAIKRALGPGSIVADRYQLGRILGEGGTGVVWEAIHTVMRRRVALKILKSKDEHAQRRFFREARVTAALRHPNIIEVSDLFIVPETGTPAMVMEILEGSPLSSWTRPKGRPVPITLRQAARVLVPVASALGAAHAAGVVHRDLKPENVFLVGPAPSLDLPYVKVLDFGLAKLTAAEGDVMSSGQLTRSGFVLGTPHYMAPEQVSGEHPIAPPTDVWALGVILYESLSGVRPIDGPNLSRLFRAVLEAPIAPLDKLGVKMPKAVIMLTSRMLSRSPHERPRLDEVVAVLSAHA